MIRPTTLAAAIAVSLLAASGAGGAPEQTPKRGGTVYTIWTEPSCLNPLVCGGNLYVQQVLEGASEPRLQGHDRE